MTKFQNRTTGYVVMPFAGGTFAVVAPAGAVIAEKHPTMEAALAHARVMNAEPNITQFQVGKTYTARSMCHRADKGKGGLRR
jgi:hypothetical protein